MSSTGPFPCAWDPPRAPRPSQPTSFAPFGWERLAGWAGQPSHRNTVYMNQPAVLLSHINEPATIRISQPNRLLIFFIFIFSLLDSYSPGLQGSNFPLPCLSLQRVAPVVKKTRRSASLHGPARSAAMVAWPNATAHGCSSQPRGGAMAWPRRQRQPWRGHATARASCVVVQS